MGWSKGLLVLWFIFCYVQPGAPALSKAALEQSKVMMKNICKRSSGVSQENLNELKAGVFTDDPKFKCYVHCCLGMMKTVERLVRFFGKINSDEMTMKKDKITAAEAIKQVELLLPKGMRDATLKQLNACKDTVGSDACDIAFNFIKCCHQIDPNNILIPS